LTMRNWLIGCYVQEYELGNQARAQYGDRLLLELSRALAKHQVSNTGHRQLYSYRAFYRAYPQLVRTLSAHFFAVVPGPLKTAQLSPKPKATIASDQLLQNLSYSHFELLTSIDDDVKRAFYEAQCLRSRWSVRELKRQIATLLYERTSLSRDKAATVALAEGELESAALVVRDPYVFEFLGLKATDVMRESDLEHALLGRLQEFLLELGQGFCFESSQKRILIGGEHFFVDLVFYHRILKCHVLTELKIGGFSHEHLGQLNTYVSWFDRNEKTTGDNPPVGILLCTEKNQALVEYALAGMDNQLFVSKYQLALPGKEEMQRFVEDQMAGDLRTLTQKEE
jgi:predicted nuclease of restriction endonuclease-like (RecB) superfamily